MYHNPPVLPVYPQCWFNVADGGTTLNQLWGHRGQ